MRARSKIILSNAALFLGVSSTCLIIIHAVILSNANRLHLQESYDQLQNVHVMASAANQLSEQLAELTVLGLEEIAAVDEADRELSEAIDQQLDFVNAEIQGIEDDPEELQQEQGEIAKIHLLQDIQTDLMTNSRRIIDKLTVNDQVAATRIYRDDIERSLDNEMDELIALLLEEESREIQQALVDSDELAWRSLVLLMAVIAIVALMTMTNAYLINRTIARPLVSLTRATEAVTRGELTHAIRIPSTDEFGELGNRFNHMLNQLAAERERVKQAQSVLEQQVMERTNELATANLKLRDIDASRSNFLADISHELRTPLTVLRGQAEIALRDPEREVDDMRHTLQRIVTKSAQIGRLVDDLLLLSRSESGSIGIEDGDVKLQDVIADVLLDSEQLSRRGRIFISARQPEEPVLIRGDAQRLRQAILIGLDNAVKYAPDQSTVSIELLCDDQHAHIFLRDQGPGFGEQELLCAFDRFYRGTDPSGRSSRGLGLGLSIAKWITEQHQGSIGIENDENGAVIHLRLPLTENMT
ncbi:ATP-binding protein [Granulosicoccus sp. 3-233]|uniref:sensor histidine kinase n=1 Tax=Granulosicoccus sp. 3-233 TaxID=3417969 RepID=UPI003D35959A